MSHEGKLNRIVSLTPSNTEILFALGLGKQVVGVTAFCNYPPEARKKPKVGDVNISVERVLALKPDLVIAHRLLNARVIPTLKRLGVKVIAVEPKSLQGLMSTILSLGERTGKAKEAKQLVLRLKHSLQQVQAQVARVPSHPRVLFLIGVEPLWAAGGETFADELIRLAGGRNILQGKVKGFRQVSLETVLASDPEVIVITGEPRKNPFRNPAWHQTTALRTNRVYFVDADLFTREGPRLIEALQTLFRLLHKSKREAHSLSS